MISAYSHERAFKAERCQSKALRMLDLLTEWEQLQTRDDLNLLRQEEIRKLRDQLSDTKNITAECMSSIVKKLIIELQDAINLWNETLSSLDTIHQDLEGVCSEAADHAQSAKETFEPAVQALEKMTDRLRQAADC